jgi:hypothetical protein
MTLQKDNNLKIEDLVDSEEDESFITEVKRMIRIFNKLKEDI